MKPRRNKKEKLKKRFNHADYQRFLQEFWELPDIGKVLEVFTILQSNRYITHRKQSYRHLFPKTWQARFSKSQWRRLALLIRHPYFFSFDVDGIDKVCGAGSLRDLERELVEVFSRPGMSLQEGYNTMLKEFPTGLELIRRTYAPAARIYFLWIAYMCRLEQVKPQTRNKRP